MRHRTRQHRFNLTAWSAFLAVLFSVFAGMLSAPGTAAGVGAGAPAAERGAHGWVAIKPASVRLNALDPEAQSGGQAGFDVALAATDHAGWAWSFPAPLPFSLFDVPVSSAPVRDGPSRAPPV